MGVKPMLNPCHCSYNEKVVKTFVNDSTPLKVPQHRHDASPATRPLKRISKFTHDSVLSEFADIGHIEVSLQVAPAAAGEEEDTQHYRSESSAAQYRSEISAASSSRAKTVSVLSLDMDGHRKTLRSGRISMQNGNRRVSCAGKVSQEDILNLVSQVLGNSDPDSTIAAGKLFRASVAETEVLQDGTLYRNATHEDMLAETTKFCTPWERGMVVPSGHFLVSLDRDEDDDEVGLDVDWGDMVKLKIVAIKEGLMAAYNIGAHESGGRIVNAGDFIVNINGVQGSSCKLMKLIRESPNLKLLIRNGAKIQKTKSFLD